MTLTLKKFYLNQRKKTIANSWTFNKHNRQNILLKKKKTPSILRSLQYYHNRFVLKDYPCLILKINGLKNIKWIKTIFLRKNQSIYTVHPIESPWFYFN